MRIKRNTIFYAAPDEIGGSSFDRQNDISKDAPVEGEVEPDFSGLGSDPIEPDELQKEEINRPVTKIPEQSKAEEKKPEPEKPAETTEAKPEPEKTEEKKPELPKDDTDLDAIKPRAGSNPKIGNDFDKLRNVAKEARGAARTLQGELETVRKELETVKAAPPTQVQPTDEVIQKLEAEKAELTKRVQMHDLASDPALQAEFKGKLSKADENILSILTGQLGVPDDKAKIMQERGLDSYSQEWWDQQVLSQLPDGMAKQRLVHALFNRDGVKADHEATLRNLAENRDAFLSEKGKAEEKYWADYSKGVENVVTDLAKDAEWANPKQSADNATAAEKAAAQAHNAELAKRTAEFRETVIKIQQNDPVTVGKTVFKAFQSDIIQAELAKFKDENAAHMKRIADLESDIAATTSAGRMSHRQSAPVKPANAAKQSVHELHMAGQQVEPSWED